MPTSTVSAHPVSSSHYAQFKLPEGVEASGVRVAKDRADGKWKVSMDLGEHGRTDKKEISFDDGYALFKTKTATREQIAAKYLNTEITAMLNGPAMKMEKSASMRITRSLCSFFRRVESDTSSS